MSKKKLFVMMALVIVIAILGTGTLAYFTTKAVVHNVITTGGVGITLEEKMLDENGNEVDYENPKDHVSPGEPVSKIVRVKNDDEPAWIRVRVDMRVETPRDEMDPREDITLDYNTEDWTYKNGWYYYNDILPSGQRTTPLFEKVNLSGEGMGNEYQNSTIYIDVKAQAVQAANNPPQVENDVTTVQGWPND